MSQHFLLSAEARTLSLAKVLRLSEGEAYETFKQFRWAANDGEPVCPRCGSVEAYQYRARRIFKCKACAAQFSVTTATIFASRKMSYRDLLAAIAIFVNGAKGSGPYLSAYANEMAWREDNRRVPNGTQYLLVAGAALAHSVSRGWKGYWQRAS